MCALWAGQRTARRRIASISSRRRSSDGRSEIGLLGLAPDEREERDRDRRGDGDTGERIREVAAVSGRENPLDRCVGRGEEIAELIDEARKRSAYLGRRHLVQMRRHNAPAALDHELHEETRGRENDWAAREGPE